MDSPSHVFLSLPGQREVATAAKAAAAARAESELAESEWPSQLEAILVKYQQNPSALAGIKQSAKVLTVRSERHAQRLRAELQRLERYCLRFGQVLNGDLTSLRSSLEAEHEAATSSLAEELNAAESAHEAEVEHLRTEIAKRDVEIARLRKAHATYGYLRSATYKQAPRAPVFIGWMGDEARHSVELEMAEAASEADYRLKDSQHRLELVECEPSHRQNLLLSTNVEMLAAALTHERRERARERAAHQREKVVGRERQKALAARLMEARLVEAREHGARMRAYEYVSSRDEKGEGEEQQQHEAEEQILKLE